MRRLAAALFLAAVLPAADGAPEPKVPLGLLPVPWPADNPYSPDKAELGRALFFDPRLSQDSKVSCANCHMPKYAFGDGLKVSEGFQGQTGRRNAPTVINRAYSLAQFWDGRAATLEEQVKGPIENPVEMALTLDAAVERLRRIPGYAAWFERVFGTRDFTIEHVTKAVATFERTVLSGNSPYDRYKAGDKKAMSAAQVRGMKVFFEKAKCDQCHEGINFTTNAFHNLGVGMDKPNPPDLGRYEITKDPKDWGAFKTPTLRDVALTAPYMHDGSLKTLEEVVEFYNRGGIPNQNRDEKITALRLSERDRKDLVEFLKALSGEGWQHLQGPEKLP
jgi:cytochrome c peroxidase